MTNSSACRNQRPVMEIPMYISASRTDQCAGDKAGGRTVKRLSAVSVKKMYTLKTVPLSVAEYVNSNTSCGRIRVGD